MNEEMRKKLAEINATKAEVRQLIADGKLDEAEAKKQELVRELERLLRHMDWLIQSLLKMAKLDAGAVQMKRDTVTVERLVREATGDLMIPMELRQQTLLVSCPEGASFQGDLSWMREALGNIVKNCMEHTSSGGRIRVMGRENAVFSELVIEDNGDGLPKQDLPHLFERF